MSGVFEQLFLVERVNAYMIGNEMFALKNIIIYSKCKQLLIRAYIHRQQSLATYFYKIVELLKKSTLNFSIFEYKIAKSYNPKDSGGWGLSSQTHFSVFFWVLTT